MKINILGTHYFILFNASLDARQAHNTSLGLIFSALLKYVNCVSVYFEFNKNLYIIDFPYNLSTDGKYKQVKITEVYLFWIFSIGRYE